MPELPEVETVVKRLRQQIVGAKINAVKVYWPAVVVEPHVAEFQRSLKNLRVTSIWRRGKFIVLELSSERYLFVHLRMSGDLVVVPHRQRRTKHEHLILQLSGGKDLRFDDTRKFGRAYLVKNTEQIEAKLGPEPLASGFTVGRFSAMLTQKKSLIKSLLLDQKFLAGLGNIYVVESLWRAGIHPLRRANSLEFSEVRALHKAIRFTLRKAIQSSGTDIGDGVWKAGNYRTKVYGREGSKCQRCSMPIMRIVLAQRGTEFCAACQK